METRPVNARFLLLLAASLWVAGLSLLDLPPGRSLAHGDGPATASMPVREVVPREHIIVDDGDSIALDGPAGRENIRLLGIDAPEVQHLAHDIPFDQPFGPAAHAFLRGCLAVGETCEILRAKEKDPYGRTLGYLFVNGKNTSVLILQAGLAMETVSRYGDNGLPTEAAACTAAARTQGALAFEDPRDFRRRMAKVATRMKAAGTYPQVATDR